MSGVSRGRIGVSSHRGHRSSTSNHRPTSARVIIGAEDMGRRAVDMRLVARLVEEDDEDVDEVQAMDDDVDDDDEEDEDDDVDMEDVNDNVMMFSGSDDPSSDADVGDDGAENDQAPLPEPTRMHQQSNQDVEVAAGGGPSTPSRASSKSSIHNNAPVAWEDEEDSIQYVADYILNLVSWSVSVVEGTHCQILTALNIGGGVSWEFYDMLSSMLWEPKLYFFRSCVPLHHESGPICVLSMLHELSLY